MSPGERRAARKAARAAGTPRTGELETRGDRGAEPVEFGEGPAGRRALELWARSYDLLNGAPENEGDR